MAETNGDRIDLEPTDQYVRKTDVGLLGLESIDAYLRRVKAEIKMSRARAANVVAYILVAGLVFSLPLYVLAVAVVSGDVSEDLAAVFTKWYDVVAPLIGAVIGALFGMSIASRRTDQSD